MKLSAVRVCVHGWEEACDCYPHRPGLPLRFRDDDNGRAGFDAGGTLALPRDPDGNCLSLDG